MSINPNLIPTGGFDPRVASILADVQRQLGQAMANINSIPAGGVSGGPGGQIKATSITSSEISAGAIVAGTIAAGAVTAGTIAAGAINSNTLFVSGVIQASSIQSNTITATQIAAHTITSTELTSTAIDGMTITGSTIKTSAGAGSTGAGVVITTAGVRGYDATPTQQFFLDATTGLIQAKGVILAQAGSALPVSTITGYLPAGANRYSNSAFQNGASTFDTTSWTISAATSATGGTTAPPVYGALTMKLTATGATVAANATPVTDPYRRVLPGISYTASHYVYPTSTARQSRIDIGWYDSGGTLLSTTAGVAAATTLNQWTRVSTTAAAPANAAYAVPVHNIALSAVAAEISYTECFQFEEGDRASAWSPRPDEILVNQINAVNINVANLSAISANLGTITAGTITGTTITGGTIQTASGTGARIDMTGASNAFRTFNSSNVQQMQIDGTNGVQFLSPAAYTQTAAVQWYQGTLGSTLSGVINNATDGVSVNRVETYALQGTLNSTGRATILSLIASSALDVGNALSATVNTAAGTPLTKIILRADGGGSSDFLQISAGPKQTVFWSGAVFGSNGAKRPTIGTTSGVGTWTSTRTGVGSYTLTLSGGVSGAYAIPVPCINEANGYVRMDYASNTTTTTTFNVFTLQSTGGLPTLFDANWSFHAIGASA